MKRLVWTLIVVCFSFYINQGEVTAHELSTKEKALQALKGQDYGIIIVDYRLPGMDGLEFFRRIHESHPEAFKILITAFMSDEVVSEAMKMGVQDFIEKPFTSRTIEESLKKVLENHES